MIFKLVLCSPPLFPLSNHLHILIFLLCFILKLGLNNWLFGHYSCLEWQSILGHELSWLSWYSCMNMIGSSIWGSNEKSCKIRFHYEMTPNISHVLYIWTWWCYWNVVETCIHTSSINELLVSLFLNRQIWCSFPLEGIGHWWHAFERHYYVWTRLLLTCHEIYLVLWLF